jgi:thiol:disulfide interchange protein DsbD
MNLFDRLLRLVLWSSLGLWSLAVYAQSESSKPGLQESQLPASGVQERSTEISTLQSLKDLIGASQSQPEFLDPEVAYLIDVQAKDADTLVARFTIEDGYYLYQDKTGFSSQTEGVNIGNVSLPEGKKKTDEYFGEQIVYYHGFDVDLPLVRAPGEVDEVAIRVDYQGCAEQGICYPPMDKVFTLSLPGIGDAQASHTTGSGNAPISAAAEGEAGLATDSQIMWAVLLAFAAGLALTFTPCVLPMIPILASIVVGQGNGGSKIHGGLLSIVYVLGTAVTYAAVGVVAGATGDQLQAYFQNPWGIGVVVVILVLLSLSMFGLYDLQMPASLQSRLQARAGHLKRGALGGVFILGLISALIVGACVSPVLIAVLGLAIERADPVLGGMIMFSMALGSGVILVGLGFGAAFLLPKVGPWMKHVNHVFGVMLLGVAVYMLGALPEVPVLYLWGILLIVSSVYLGALQSLSADASGWRYLWKGLGVFALVWGVLALLGGMTNNRDITRPIDFSGKALFASDSPGTGFQDANTHGLFTRVSEIEALDARLSQARAAGQPVMLDYYADWCVDCIRMENSTFADPRVRQILSNFVMIQVDVTDPRNSTTNALKKRYGVYGPPAMLFFDTVGKELKELRRYGFMGPDEFITHINQI